jgi:hypothetical protein
MKAIYSARNVFTQIYVSAHWLAIELCHNMSSDTEEGHQASEGEARTLEARL